MTVLDDRELAEWYAMAVAPAAGGPAPGRCLPTLRRPRAVSRGPGPVRPHTAPVRYRGTGVAVSQAPHRRRPVSTAVTLALAVGAALITLWLGSLANLTGAGTASSAVLPDRLAVVQVQAGETLQHLAGRVAPDSPVAAVVDRIRDLNDLDSAAVDAGQTLIAPIG